MFCNPSPSRSVNKQHGMVHNNKAKKLWNEAAEFLFVFYTFSNCGGGRTKFPPSTSPLDAGKALQMHHIRAFDRSLSLSFALLQPTTFSHTIADTQIMYTYTHTDSLMHRTTFIQSHALSLSLSHTQTLLFHSKQILIWLSNHLSDTFKYDLSSAFYDSLTHSHTVWRDWVIFERRWWQKNSNSSSPIIWWLFGGYF